MGSKQTIAATKVQEPGGVRDGRGSLNHTGLEPLPGRREMLREGLVKFMVKLE
jgi:hypothetical protein